MTENAIDKQLTNIAMTTKSAKIDCVALKRLGAVKGSVSLTTTETDKSSSREVRVVLRGQVGDYVANDESVFCDLYSRLATALADWEESLDPHSRRLSPDFGSVSFETTDAGGRTTTTAFTKDDVPHLRAAAEELRNDE